MSVDCFFIFQHGIDCLPCALLPNFVKTAFSPSMTGNAAILFNQHDHRVAIAIQAQFMYFLRMSGLFALHPLFLAGTAVIVGKTGFYSFLQGFGVHSGNHQHTACLPILGNRANQTFFIKFYSIQQRFVYVRHSHLSLIFSDGLWIAITNALQFLLRAWSVSLRGYSLRQSGKYWRPIPHLPFLL